MFILTIPPSSTTHVPSRSTKHLLHSWRKTESEFRKKAGQCATGDEGQDDEHEDFDGVLFHVVDEIAEETAQFGVDSFEVAFSRRAFIVG